MPGPGRTADPERRVGEAGFDERMDGGRRPDRLAAGRARQRRPQPVAGFERAAVEATEPGGERGRARAQHDRHLDATRETEIAPDSGFAGRGAGEAEHGSCLEAIGPAGPEGLLRAVVREGGDAAEVGARDREDHGLDDPELRPDEGQLQRGGCHVVAEQRVRRGQAPWVRRTAMWHPELTETRPTSVLDRRLQPAGEDLEDHRRAAQRPVAWGTNLTRDPGASSAGLGRARFQSRASVRPMSCQPPGISNG